MSMMSLLCDKFQEIMASTTLGGTGYQELIQETRMTPEETVTSKAGYKKQFQDWKDNWAQYKED